jgi:hypothetical protein
MDYDLVKGKVDPDSMRSGADISKKEKQRTKDPNRSRMETAGQKKAKFFY